MARSRHEQQLIFVVKQQLLGIFKLRPRLVAATTDTVAVMPATIELLRGVIADEDGDDSDTFQAGSGSRHVHANGCFFHRLHLTVTGSLEMAALMCIDAIHKAALKIRASAVLPSHFEKVQLDASSTRTPLPGCVTSVAEDLGAVCADLSADLLADVTPKTSAPPLPIKICWNSLFRL